MTIIYGYYEGDFCHWPKVEGRNTPDPSYGTGVKKGSLTYMRTILRGNKYNYLTNTSNSLDPAYLYSKEKYSKKREIKKTTKW